MILQIWVLSRHRWVEFLISGCFRGTWGIDAGDGLSFRGWWGKLGSKNFENQQLQTLKKHGISAAGSWMFQGARYPKLLGIDACWSAEEISDGSHVFRAMRWVFGLKTFLFLLGCFGVCVCVFFFCENPATNPRKKRNTYKRRWVIKSRFRVYTWLECLMCLLRTVLFGFRWIFWSIQQ